MPTVELGNAAPKGVNGPAVTYIHVPDADESGQGGYTISSSGEYPAGIGPLLKGVKNAEARRLIVDGWMNDPDLGRSLPDHEAFVAIAHRDGLWAQHSDADPTWVWSDNQMLAEHLAEHYGIPIGAPADVEDTHTTRAGGPGVRPDIGLQMLKTQSGNDIQAIQMGGGLLGETGAATATTATSLTTNSARSAAANDLAGQTVVAWSNGAYGLITANTAGTLTVLTVDRWYAPATPGGAAAATPTATTGYTVISGGLPAWFMGLTANATAPAATDVTLAAEITTAGGGLIRKICSYAHTAGVNTFTLTAVFTANGSDTLPVTVAKAGVSQSLTAGVRNLWQTLPNATATFSLSGDQATFTDTVTT